MQNNGKKVQLNLLAGLFSLSSSFSSETAVMSQRAPVSGKTHQLCSDPVDLNFLLLYVLLEQVKGSAKHLFLPEAANKGLIRFFFEVFLWVNSNTRQLFGNLECKITDFLL